VNLPLGEITPMPSPLEAVSTYFYAEDGNRPYLMRHAFAEDVELEMVVKTDAISFPRSANGLRALEDVLCRRFANDFENVYTFCLQRPTDANRRHFPCDWLVGMSAKDNGGIRIGSGRYDWYFSPGTECLVQKLIITIDVMQVLPADRLDGIMSWISSLPYPWCSQDELVENMPSVEWLVPIERYLRDIRPIPPEC
jgi:hypothetical protein